MSEEGQETGDRDGGHAYVETLLQKFWKRENRER